MRRFLPIVFFVLCSAVALMAAAASTDPILKKYVTAAVASEQCGEGKLSLLQEIRLAQLVKHESTNVVTSFHIRDGMALVRAAPPLDCALPAVIAQVRMFRIDMLPQLMVPYMPPARDQAVAPARE